MGRTFGLLSSIGYRVFQNRPVSAHSSGRSVLQQSGKLVVWGEVKGGGSPFETNSFSQTFLSPTTPKSIGCWRRTTGSRMKSWTSSLRLNSGQASTTTSSTGWDATWRTKKNEFAPPSGRLRCPTKRSTPSSKRLVAVQLWGLLLLPHRKIWHTYSTMWA